MNTIRGILGIALLFLGRELNFLFAGGMAALLAYRISPSLPAAWPQWAVYVFVLGIGVIATATPLINERLGYAVSGFFGGGYFMVEYFAPGVATLPLLPFIVGSVVGAVVMGLFTEWALMIISSAVGAFFASELFTVSPELKMMISGGLFLAGALTQVIIRRVQQQ